MTPSVDWQHIAIRLALTLIAGGLLGFERSKTGHFAGLRTTLLVSLAASVSMIQMNLLMQTNGRPPNSFAVMDLMRLPLGILTGVGFIGAGAIVRKNEMVVGVTTAATLWFATIVGLCLGGGQVVLGSVSSLLGFLVLWGLRRFENRIEIYRPADLTLTIAGGTFAAGDLRARLDHARIRVESLSVAHDLIDRQRTFSCRVRWPSAQTGADTPAILTELERLPGLLRLDWQSTTSQPGGTQRSGSPTDLP
jgi:putative Mg2+ transporter-C (MgtC) family protein